MYVLREWRHIDILLLDKVNEVVVIIENKIDTREHSNQLERYWADVAAYYPSYRRLGLYLTPSGDPPLHSAYVPISYATICNLVESLVDEVDPAQGDDVRLLLSHYAEMLRRNVVGDSEIDDLCRRIYREHQRALDLIYQYRPDPEAQIHHVLERLVRGSPHLIFDSRTTNVVRFLPKEWDVTALKVADRWSKSKRILLVEFWSSKFWGSPDYLRLTLTLGPSSNEDVRRGLFEVAQSNQPPFRVSRSLSEDWVLLFDRPLPITRVGIEIDPGALEDEIRPQLETFIEHDLPAMTGAIRSAGLLG